MEHNREPLTPDEIELLRELLPVADDLKREAEYKMAVRLVAKTWRAAILWVAGIIGAVVLVREEWSRFWIWMGMP